MIITDSSYFLQSGDKMNFILTIWEEMLKGNFSFAILIVGIIQCGLMIWNGKKKK